MARGRSGGGVRATALVVSAEAPPEGGHRLSKLSKAAIRILVDAGSGPALVERSSHLKREQWLVPGMEVVVTIDPGQPDEFEIDWSAVPPIEDRAAAGDPTLADPLRARRRVAEALSAAGIPGQAKAGVADRVAEAMERAAGEAAPAGKQRAVVLVAAIRARLVPSGVDGGGPMHRVTSGKCNAVLSVNVPGREPYALYEKKFKRPGDRGDITGAGLPALVSARDPAEVEILWDELASLGDQVGQRMAAGMQASQAGAAGMEEQMTAAVQRASSQAPPGTPRAAPAPGLNPQMKAMLENNARMALRMTKDPAQRKMLIEQYRLAGIEIEDE